MFGQLAKRLEAEGFAALHCCRREASGAVTQALAIDGFTIGPQIAPGVPWVRGIGKPLSLALKSGNFGTEAFFEAQKIANQEGDK
ncbi:nucleotide-binding domain containing protein [Brucella abortus]|nr:nucleotide-binding domain containing protein [Brucella abortus]